MRVAGVWSGEGFTDWQGINFDHKHWYWPRTRGKVLFETENVPGWANPANGSFEDQRIVGLDGRRFGPLPREWTQFKGLYRHAQRIVISYTVGKAGVLESHLLTTSGAIARILNIEKSESDLKLRLANSGATMSIQGSDAIKLEESNGFLTASIPARATPLNVAFIFDPVPFRRLISTSHPLRKEAPRNGSKAFPPRSSAGAKRVLSNGTASPFPRQIPGRAGCELLG